MKDPVHVDGEDYDREALIDYVNNGDTSMKQFKGLTVQKIK